MKNYRKNEEKKSRPFWKKWEETPMMDDNWRLTVYMLISFTIELFLGLLVQSVIMVLLGMIMIILYGLPRIGKHGNLYFKKLREEFFAQVRTDVVPKPPLGKMTLAVLLLSTPLYFFWLLTALVLFFIGSDVWLFTFIPTMVISVVILQSVKWRWVEMDGKKWMFWGIYVLVYGVFLFFAFMLKQL